MNLLLKIIIGILCVIIAGILFHFLPILQLPRPTGKYAVGTTVMEFSDKSRKEIYSKNPEDQRVLAVRFFYPIKNSHGFEKYLYLGDKLPYFQKYMAATNHLPESLMKLLLRNINTHSYIDAPIATEQLSYPVILFSHGGFGLPSDMYISILENLASHGYIIAAIDHPYFNGLTIYKNGKIITDQKLSDQFNKMNQKDQKEFLATIVDIFKADLVFLINELTKLNANQNNIFYHHLDFNRIAAMGHSAGGTSAIEFCRDNAQCKAAIDLDGWYDHVIGEEPIKKPLLLIFAEETIKVSEPTLDYLKRKELTRAQYFEYEKKIDAHRKKLCSVPTCSIVIIPQATHGDFNDLIFLKWPFRAWNAVDSYKIWELLNSSILDFFSEFATA